jgi:hypothetical protein
MRPNRFGSLALGLCLLAVAALQASDLVGVYTVVEKVVLEPNDTAPTRVQIWGGFALSDQKSGSNYGEAQRGYMYYTCPAGQEAICRREWADLKTMAGKDSGVGFGGRYRQNGRVRKSEDAPVDPDVYPIERGVIRLSAGHDSLPVIDRIKAVLRPR